MQQGQTDTQTTASYIDMKLNENLLLKTLQIAKVSSKINPTCIPLLPNKSAFVRNKYNKDVCYHRAKSALCLALHFTPCENVASQMQKKLKTEIHSTICAQHTYDPQKTMNTDK